MSQDIHNDGKIEVNRSHPKQKQDQINAFVAVPNFRVTPSEFPICLVLSRETHPKSRSLSMGYPFLYGKLVQTWVIHLWETNPWTFPR